MKQIARWGIVAAFVLVTAVFFYQTLLWGKLPVPSDTLVGLYHPWRDAYADTYPRGVPYKNFLITDPIRQQIPWRKAVVDAYKAGHIPALNPYSFFGVPIDANIQAAPFYPLNALFILPDFASSWSLFVMLQPLLAGLFLYWFLRNAGLSRTASFFGSVSWAFGGFAISWLTWGTIMHTALWAPLILLSVDKLLAAHAKRERIVWTIVLSIALSMSVLGGHMQVAFYSLSLGGMYALWRMRQVHASKSAVWHMALGAAAALLATTIQWAPFIAFLAGSGRFAFAEGWKAEGWFLPWQHLVQFLVPDFFGNPATLNYWGTWNYGEFVGYIGVIPLVFAVSAVSLAGFTGFFTAALAISFFLMLPTAVSRLPYEFAVPVISSLQPTRLMVLVDLSLSILAAVGFDALRKKGNARIAVSVMLSGAAMLILFTVIMFGGRFLPGPDTALHLAIARRNLMLPAAILGVAVLLLVLYRLIRPTVWKRLFLLGLVVVSVADLLRFGWKFTPFTPREYFFPETETIRFLKKQPKPFRVMALDDRILPPNAGAYYGIETIEGYDPVAPVRYEDMLVASERGKADITRPTGFNRIYTAHNVDSPLLPYFNVRYVLSLADIKRPFLREVMREGETRVYEYAHALPRVYLAETVRVAPPRDALQGLFDMPYGLGAVWGGFDDILSAPNTGEETVSISSYVPGNVRLAVVARNTRLLVVLNRYDRRWTATVDGKNTRIFPANYLFMAIVVPPGTHNVILTYR